MTLDEKDAINSVRKTVVSIECLVESVADRTDDVRAADALRGIEALCRDVAETLAAIVKGAAS